MMLAEGSSIPDPAMNAPLRKAIEKAAKQDVPKQTIQNALQKLAANKGATKRHIFEGRLFRKVMVLICINTDNMRLAKNGVTNAFKKVRSVTIVYPSFYHANYSYSNRMLVSRSTGQQRTPIIH